MEFLRDLRRLEDLRGVNAINDQQSRMYKSRLNWKQLTDDELYERIRFNHHSFRSLSRILSPHLNERSSRRTSLSKEEQIYVALRFYASGSFQQVVGDTYGVHKSTVCRAITVVTNALIKLVPTYITDRHFDSPINILFFEQKRFPGVIGAIDGTHIKIISPNEYENEFVNRKGIHSLNIQVVGTGELLIADFVADWAGGTHDSRILKESGIFGKFEAGHFQEKIILGDQGYPLKTWLFTPITKSVLTSKEQLFNNAHRSARCVIERLFGIWKRRWSCLNFLRVQPRKAARIVTACAVLHNFAILNGDTEPGLLDLNATSSETNVEMTSSTESSNTARARRAFYAAIVAYGDGPFCENQSKDPNERGSQLDHLSERGTTTEGDYSCGDGGEGEPLIKQRRKRRHRSISRASRRASVVITTEEFVESTYISNSEFKWVLCKRLMFLAFVFIVLSVAITFRIFQTDPCVPVNNSTMAEYVGILPLCNETIIQ